MWINTTPSPQPYMIHQVHSIDPTVIKSWPFKTVKILKINVYDNVFKILGFICKKFSEYLLYLYYYDQ